MRVCACPPAPRPSRYTLHDAVLLSCAIIYWHAAARYEVRPGVHLLSSPNAYYCHKITIATALPATHTMRRHLMRIRNAQRLHSLASLPHSHARCFDHPLIMPFHLFALPSSLAPSLAPVSPFFFPSLDTTASPHPRGVHWGYRRVSHHHVAGGRHRSVLRVG